MKQLMKSLLTKKLGLKQRNFLKKLGLAAEIFSRCQSNLDREG